MDVMDVGVDVGVDIGVYVGVDVGVDVGGMSGCQLDCENYLARKDCGCRDINMPSQGQGQFFLSQPTSCKVLHSKQKINRTGPKLVTLGHWVKLVTVSQVTN